MTEPNLNKPCPIFLNGREPIIATRLDAATIMLTGVHHTLQLQGIYAESLLRQLEGKSDGADQQRLSRLQQQQPWLHGLTCASLQPETLTPTLLGYEPGMLFIEVTARCNERCIHCYAESTPERNAFLTLEEIRLLLRACRDLGRPFVQFTGGDPLIHRDLVAAVAFAHDLDFSGIEIYTNGLLLTDKLLTELIPFRPRLSFSVYADAPDIHDAITGVPGSWQRTLQAMQRAQDAGFPIRAGVVIMPENIACIERMLPFLQSRFGLENSAIHFDAIHQVGRGMLNEAGKEIRMTPSHAPAAGARRRGKLCITADGEVHPCIFARHLSLGNIRTQPLDAIIGSLNMRQSALPSAERWNLCGERLSCGDCRIVAYVLDDHHQGGPGRE